MKIFNKIFKQNQLLKTDKDVVNESAKAFKKLVSDNLKVFLKPFRYKKSNTTFVLDNSELIYYIQIQSSQSSTATIAKLTVNLGILSKKLLLNTGLEPDIGHCQWRYRIGSFLDRPIDKWWIIDSIQNAQLASKEIIELIENKIFKKWATIKATNDLKNIWITGQCTGISDAARKQFLNELEK